MTNRFVLAFSLALALGALALGATLPVSAQETTGQAGRAAALDRALGPNADLPKPDSTVPAFGWLPGALPPWIAGQPYRQQPLFATVPVGGTTRGGRVRPGSGP
jgi:hypothetical protein